METKQTISLTSHKGTDIFTLIIPEDNSAQSAELLSEQYSNSTVMAFYDTEEEKMIYGVIINKEDENANSKV